MSRVNIEKQILFEQLNISLHVLCDTKSEDGVTLNKHGAESLINLLARVRNMLQAELDGARMSK